MNLEIVNFPNPIPNLTVAVHMGKISGSTLSQEIEHFALGGPTLIHSVDVIGPEIPVWVLGAPPNGDVDIQGWVFLH